MERKTIYALGFFDGVHLGHQALLIACENLAQRSDCEAGVVTFDTHPETLVTNRTPPLINTAQERSRMLMDHGLEQLLVLPFDEKLMHMPWQAFLEDLIERGAAGFVCGDDFRFGYKGEGNSQKLAQFCQERNMPYAIVPAQAIDGIRISSTHIRSLIEAGDMEGAAKFLGHPHTLSGPVVHGRQLGRTIGIPTANLLIPQEVVVPRLGVYTCTCLVDGTTYMAVTNIGSRPTVEGHQVRAESWLLDFDGDLYGKFIQLQFFKFLRPERKFPSLEELRTEIRKNGEETRKFFKKT
jgi:riboflavin kinase/FMN adenylyltransferase